MLPHRSRVAVLAIFAMASSSLGWSDVALARTSLTIGELRTMLDSMGYEAKGDAHSVSISVTGKHDLDVELQMSDVSPVLYIYTHPGGSIEASAAATIPALKLLDFNDNHPDFFAVTRFKDGTLKVALVEEIEKSAVSPRTLRMTIDRLVAAVDTHEVLWDPAQWSTTIVASPETLAASQARVDSIWEKMPLGVRRAIVVDKAAPMFGAYKARADATFKPDATMTTYFEPVGYTWKPAEGGLVKFGIAVDLEILKPDGTIVAGKKDFAALPLTDHSKVKELMLNLSVQLHDFAPGAYTAHYTLHDLYGPKTAGVSVPFTVAK